MFGWFFCFFALLLTLHLETSYLDLPEDVENLYVRANPISIKTQMDSGPRKRGCKRGQPCLPDLSVQGPFVGEPFYLELTFSPPATQAFTVTAAGSSLHSSSNGVVNIPAGSTGTQLCISLCGTNGGVDVRARYVSVLRCRLRAPCPVRSYAWR